MSDMILKALSGLAKKAKADALAGDDEAWRIFIGLGPIYQWAEKQAHLSVSSRDGG